MEENAFEDHELARPASHPILAGVMNLMTITKWKDRFDILALQFGMTPRANDYDDARMYRKIRGAISALLGSYDPQIVIDVGCGNGALAREAGHASTVFGVDVSFHMLKLAARRGIKCVQAEASALPFKSECADVALCIGMLQYLGDDNHVCALARELRRVVRPRGVIMLSTLNADSLVRKAYALLHKKTEGINFERMYQWGRLLQLCEALNLSVVNTLYFYTPFPVVTTNSKPSTLSRLLSSSFLIVGKNG
jgi:SAM-dependent methyltransferase